MSKLKTGTDDTASSIQKLMVLYLLIWSISPPLSIGNLYRFAALGAVGVWFALEILRGLNLTLSDVEAVLFVLAIIITSYIENESFSSVLKNIATFMACICFILQSHYRDRWTQLSFLIPLMIIVLIVFNIKTYTTLMTDPTIARKIVRNDDEMIPYLESGVGGYALIYLQVIIFPAVIAWVLKAFKINKIFFLIGSVWTVTYVLVVMNAGYSMALFTSLASLFILLFYKGKRAGPAVIVVMLIFVSAMFVLIYMEGIRNWLLEIFDGTAVAKKINDLVATNESGEASGSIYARVSAYSDSLNTILKYPIIGSFWNGGGGGHSAILDTFAKYGFLGGAFYCKMLFSHLSATKNTEEDDSVTRVCNACFCSVLFIGTLNSFTYEIMTPTFIIIPVISYTLKAWDERLGIISEDSVDG